MKLRGEESSDLRGCTSIYIVVSTYNVGISCVDDSDE